MGESVPITMAGRRIVEKRIADFEAQLPAVREAISDALEKGDLSENAEYHAAIEKMAIIEAQANQLRGRLARAQIVDPRRAPRDRVAFGAKVLVLDIDADTEETYRLVGLGEDDPDKLMILTTSPVGQALLLKKPGEETEAKLPGGTVRLRVLKITYPQ